jgi:hypothetical protein
LEKMMGGNIEEEVAVVDEQETGALPDQVAEDAKEEGQPSGEEGGEGTQDGQAQDDELVVQIGDEAPPEDKDSAHSWVREVRKQNRELKKENRELHARLSSDAPKAPVLGAKPRLEEFDYDADKFESALESWHEKKRAVDAETQKKADAEAAQQKEWQARLDEYSKAKASIKVPGFEDAEELVQSIFNETQQGILLDVMDNPAMMVAALGKNPDQLQRLAAITKPTKFLRELSRIEDTKLTVTPKKQAPAPERIVTGTGRTSGTVDSTLERLRADAEKTGNYTKVIAYKAKKKA